MAGEFFRQPLMIVAFVHIFCFSFAYNGTQLVKQFGSGFCPYTNFCTIGASKILPNTSVQSCCYPCFCDDDCWELDNCCPDKEDTDPFSKPHVLPCKSVEVKEGGMSLRELNTYYRIVESCPPTENNELVKSKCTGDKRTETDDFKWVSDDTNGRIFQNKYCAKCHGVDEFTAWHVGTTCTEITKANTANIIELLLSEKCNIINVIPETLKINGSKHRCFDKLVFISNCRNPILGENIDHDIATACERNYWPLFGPIPTMSFKNMFCYLCNVGTNAEFGELCKKDDSMRGADFPFGIILDFIDQPSDDHAYACRINEMKDKYLVLTNQSYSLVNKNQGLLSFSHEKEIHNRILEHLRTKVTECGLQYSDLRMGFNITVRFSYVLVIKTQLGPDCLLEFVRRNFRDIKDELVRVEINETVQLELVISFEGKTAENEINLNTRVINHFGPGLFIFNQNCKFDISLKMDKPCPSVTLKTTDTELFSEKQTKERGSYLSFFKNAEKQNNTSTVSVCLEDYLAVMAGTKQCCYEPSRYVTVLLLYFSAAIW